MKQSKNTILLIGLILGGIGFFMNLLYCILALFNTSTQADFAHLSFYTMLPLIVTLLLWGTSAVILRRNLKEKNSKVLSAVSAAICAIMLFYEIFSILTLIPRYIILSKLGHIATYFTVFLRYLTSGRVLVLLSYLFLLVGSLLSLSKKTKDI